MVWEEKRAGWPGGSAEGKKSHGPFKLCLTRAFSEAELYLVGGAPVAKSNDLGKIKCYVFDLDPMREGLRDRVSGSGRNSCGRLE